MSADKRTVSTDALETLGMIHFREEHRDAIHLAVEPVEAGEDIIPGSHIYLDAGKAYSTGMKLDNKSVGIADPFITTVIPAGSKFWLVIYPRMITSLRHVWSHPDLDKVENSINTDIEPVNHVPSFISVNPAPTEVAVVKPVDTEPLISIDAKKAEAYKWIEKYAESFSMTDGYEYGSLSVTAEELISFGKSYYTDNKKGTWPDFLNKGPLFDGEYVSDEFWDKLEIYLGEEIEEQHRGNFFSCSC